jgi:hypothetical protein
MLSQEQITYKFKHYSIEMLVRRIDITKDKLLLQSEKKEATHRKKLFLTVHHTVLRVSCIWQNENGSCEEGPNSKYWGGFPARMILSQSIELMTDNILLHCNRPMKFKCRKPDLLIENHDNDNRNTHFKKIFL